MWWFPHYLSVLNCVFRIEQNVSRSRTDFRHYATVYLGQCPVSCPGNGLTACERVKIELAPAARASINSASSGHAEASEISHRVCRPWKVRENPRCTVLCALSKLFVSVFAHKKPTTPWPTCFIAARTFAAVWKILLLMWWKKASQSEKSVGVSALRKESLVHIAKSAASHTAWMHVLIQAV